MTPVRFAIVGSGGIAAKHAEAISAIPGAKLVAVWGQIPEQGLAFARAHRAEFVPDLDGLAAREDIDAVTIATPSGTHAMAALPFLRTGKAVLCEKMTGSSAGSSTRNSPGTKIS